MQRHSQNRFTPSFLGAGLVALAALTLLGAGAAWGQFANDGASQNIAGGWDLHPGYCNPGPAIDRNACRAIIISHSGAPVAPYDTQSGCEAAKFEWKASSGGLTDVCRGKWIWDGADANYVGTGEEEYNNCTRCHAPEPSYTGAGAGVGGSYVMTGHKNMLRPVAPVGLGPPWSLYYTPNFPWAGSDGTAYPSDSNGRFINWSTGQIDTNKDLIADTDLYWIYDGWIGDLPRSHFGTGNYNCGRCHSTGWEASAADEEQKLPYLMFLDTDPGGNVVGSWDQWGIQCSRCHGSRTEADGATYDYRHHPNVSYDKATITTYWPSQADCETPPDGSTPGVWNPTPDPSYAPKCTDGAPDYNSVGMTANGATRTNLCMDCHRQEDDLGDPMDAAAPGTHLKVGDAHGHLGLVSHSGGNEYLNSPHARFGGTFAQIGDASEYDTHFTEYYGGPVSGCTGCHNVHESTVAAANPDGGAFHEECLDCHTKDLSQMRHPWSKNTPLANAATDPMESCEICHMPGALHLFRINVDPSYDTFPLAAYAGGTHNANTVVDDEGFDAVWVDVDMACGQCHGGGSEYVLTSGDMAIGSKDLTVPLGQGAAFTVGDPVEVHGAGASGGNLHTFVSNVVGDVVTLYNANASGNLVEGAEVVQNPTSNGAGYISKDRLAVLAEGIHGDAPMANFTYSLDGADTLTVNVSAALSTCNGSYANCNSFSWDWGDGSAPGSGDPASHTYATPGKKTITLTVVQYGHKPASKSKVVNTYATDYPPTISATCSWNANTWTMTVTDTGSTDDHGIVQGAVTWGDGSLTSVQSPPTVPFTHTYMVPGVFMVQYRIVDSVGQMASFVCPPADMATPAYFSISGEAWNNGKTLTLQGVKITVLDGGTIVKTVYTDAAGAYVIPNLKPGIYTLFPTKNGYGFTTQDVEVGPSKTVADPTETEIVATSNPRLAPKGNNGKKPDRPAKSSRVKGF